MIASTASTTTPKNPGTLNGAPLASSPADASGKESPLDRAKRVLNGDIRPEDYLPVSDDIIAFVDENRPIGALEMMPEARHKMLSHLALQQLHGGEDVLVYYLPEGAIVLATGLDSCLEIERSLSSEEQGKLVLDAPPVPFEH